MCVGIWSSVIKSTLLGMKDPLHWHARMWSISQYHEGMAGSIRDEYNAVCTRITLNLKVWG